MKNILALVAAASISAMSAHAATLTTIDIEYFGSTGDGDLNLAGARAAQAEFAGETIVGGDDFERFTACPADNCTATNFTGDFAAYEHLGTGAGGGSVVGPKDQAVIRDRSQYGRFNTTAGGSQYLDSNDNKGIRINTGAVPGMFFDRVSFLLMDADDVGSLEFNIAVGGEVESDTLIVPDIGGAPTGGPNGSLYLVTLLFSDIVSSVTVDLFNDTSERDGFAIDDVVGSVSAVPLPAAGWMLIAGFGGLAALKRRRKTA